LRVLIFCWQFCANVLPRIRLGLTRFVTCKTINTLFYRERRALMSLCSGLKAWAFALEPLARGVFAVRSQKAGTVALLIKIDYTPRAPITSE